MSEQKMERSNLDMAGSATDVKRYTVRFTIDPALQAYLAYLESEEAEYSNDGFALFAAGYRAHVAEQEAAAPALLAALEAFAAAREHVGECDCDDDCDIAVRLWAGADKARIDAIAAARHIERGDGGGG